MHTRDGLRGAATEANPPPDNGWITECNDSCSCKRWRRGGKRCLNRVVQSAPVNHAHRLLVFHTVDRGWGVLTVQPIPAWQYVCEYTGEVISDALAETRTDQYLFNLRPDLITPAQLGPATEPPVNDATQVGHIARFINHSCNPNCSAYQVLTTGRDPLVFSFAFFSNSPISAGEELTINYDYPEEHKQRLFGGECRCDACVKERSESGSGG